MKRLLFLLLVPFAAGLAGCADPVPAEAVAGAAYVRIQVEGMHCGMCASSVRGFLKKVDGIVATHVDVPSGTVLAKLAPGKNPGDNVLKKAVYDAGFVATSITRPPGDYAAAVEHSKQ